MLHSAFVLLVGSTFLMLRMGTNSGSFPRPLSEQEESKYVQSWMNGDVEARNKLIEHNLRLVAHIIKKYYSQTADQDDIISIGTIGLIKGVSSYRPDKGVRLATYASRCIENEVLMYFRSRKKSAGDLSLSEAVESDSEDGGLSIMDTVSMDDDLLENISAKETADELRQYVNTVLTDREANIIRMRYGLDGLQPRTQREVSVICGISRSYVSRIEKKALEKLKQEFDKNDVV